MTPGFREVQAKKIARWLSEGWCLLTVRICGNMVTFPYWHEKFGKMEDAWTDP